MKILLLGASGFVGSHLKIELDPLGFELKCPDKSVVNLKSENTIKQIFKSFQPDILINLAGCGKPEYCELNKEESYANNVTGMEHLIKYAKIYNTKFLYLSSTSAVHASNSYGNQKKKAEYLLFNSNLNYKIVRSDRIYGWNDDFISLCLERLENKKDLSLNNKIIRYPIYIKDIIRIFRQLLTDESNIRVINLTLRQGITKYEWGKLIANIWGYSDKYFKPKEILDDLRPLDCKLERTPQFKVKTLKQGVKDIKKSQ